MPTLMVSISGIRGLVGDGLDPEILVKFTSAYADLIGTGTVVVGRDARITGEMVKNIVIGTLTAKGLNVLDIGITPTPTVQYTVKTLKAQGGIAISASHNPNEWNALKLTNSSGQFLNPDEYKKLISLLEKPENKFAGWEKVGMTKEYPAGLKKHKEDVLALKFIDVEAIKKRKFKVVADCVNGAGSYIIPELLEDLGCEVIKIDCEKNGIFPRLPEPLPENLTKTMELVKNSDVDLGIVVDPDVDRLVLITENGEPFGEENTIAQAVRFILSKQKGSVCVNLSTTRSVEDIAAENGCQTYRAPVGEANVVKKMKECGAIIGGEGSGGVILPELHYGRDALVGIAITLQHLLEFGKPLSGLKKEMPAYFIAKKKADLTGVQPDEVLEKLASDFKDEKINTEDGLKIDFEDHWVHFRKSNTEPIIRIVTEAKSKEKAEELSDFYFNKIKSLF